MFCLLEVVSPYAEEDNDTPKLQAAIQQLNSALQQQRALALDSGSPAEVDALSAEAYEEEKNKLQKLRKEVAGLMQLIIELRTASQLVQQR